jgi:CRISPR-associated protein Cas2
VLYVIAYDVSNDKMRDQLANRLLDFGVRIQESVFEAVLDEDLYVRMVSRIESVRLRDTDRVRIYRICARCAEQSQIWGSGDLTRDPDFYLV